MPKKKTSGAKDVAKLAAVEGWVGVQARTFTTWLNHKLRLSKIKIGDVVSDLGDGLVLIALMEQLSAKKMIGK